MDIYGVTFHQTEGQERPISRMHAERLTLLENVLVGIAGTSEQSLVVLPAGFLRISSLSHREVVVRACQGLARDARVALAFGIDLVGGPRSYVCLNEPVASYGYICRGSELACWAACHLNCAAPAEERALQRQTISLGGIRLCPLIGGEIFIPKIRRRIEVQKPDLIIILAQAGITRRWLPALSALERTAPLLIVGQRLGSSTRLWETPPRGWVRTTFGDNADLTVHRYQLLAPQRRELGVEQLRPELKNLPLSAHQGEGIRISSGLKMVGGCLTPAAETGELFQ